MKLLDNWREVLSRAWSLKLIGFAAFLEIASNIVPLLSDYLPWWATLLVMLTAAGARLLQQPAPAQEATDGNKA
jgi:hypothetical protein